MLNQRASAAVAGNYLLGATLGALLSASTLFVMSGLLSPIPPTVRATVLLIGVAGLAARSTGQVSFPLPQNGRQIPREVFLLNPARAAFRFAFELGTSVRTYITKNAPYAAALVILLALPTATGSALWGAALVGLGFAAGRTWIVATQLVRDTVIVEHPAWALHAANWLTLGLCVLLALRRI